MSQTTAQLISGTSAQSPTFGATTVTSLNGGPIAGTRNRIINGDMRIDQRNAGASVTPTATGTYTLDRWVSYITQASKYSVQRNAGSVATPAGFSNYLGATSLSSYSVTSTDFFDIAQNIEGFNTSDLAWGTANAANVCLSFWVRSSLTGTFGGTISGTNRYFPFSYAISSSNTWEYKTVAITGDTSGTWATDNSLGIQVRFSLGAGATYLAAAGSWTATPVVGATGQTSVVGTSGATFYITGVQLEPGTVATPFERRSYGQELALCQRYFETSYPSEVAPGSATSAVGIGGISLNVGDLYTSYSPTSFAVVKRVGPTITFYAAVTGQLGVLYNFSAAGVQGNAGARFGTQNGVAVFCNNNAMTVTNAFGVNYTASAEL